MTSEPAASVLRALFAEIAGAVDGAKLVREGLASVDVPAAARRSVLAIGKVAFPMFDGLLASAATPPARALLVAPATRFPESPRLPPGAQALVADHPEPTARSVEAASRALAMATSLGADDELIVLMSGGGSALLTAPAPGLSLEDKRAAVKAVARGGATIAELNAVRKHLSAVKGGRLALATAARTTVLALSDVVGNDPGIIASGPFSPDRSTFAEALELVERLAQEAPATVRAHLAAGVAGSLPETPKPGDTRLAHVACHVLAGPERVLAEARQAIGARGLADGRLERNTEAEVAVLARAFGERARHERSAGGRARVLAGNGEPRIVVTGDGRGGRATHLALLMARELAGLGGVAFLAAGTDDRDGSSRASGAVVDGETWDMAVRQGLDPEGALARCDSEAPLEALGCLVRGPGTSNLLDVHLLMIG